MEWLLYFNTHMIITIIITLILGAMIGSFLNVVIYRYPIMLKKEWHNQCVEYLEEEAAKKTETFNLNVPLSHCAHCKKLLPFWMNIPIFSFIILGGKCRYCHEKISRQYIFVEFLSACLAIAVVIQFGLTWHTLGLLIFTYTLVALSFIDFRHQILPDTLTLSVMWVGLFFSIQYLFTTPTYAILGAMIGYMFLWCIGRAYYKLRKKEGIGYGDYKMLAMIGAWVGVLGLCDVILLATILSIIVSLTLLAFKKIKRGHMVSFGPFLAIGAWLTLMFGAQLSGYIALWIQ